MTTNSNAGSSPVDRRVSARPITENEMELTFEDALRIARGCADYGGGHRSNPGHYEIYQHGIQTVINALTAASKTGLEDTQTRALHVMGANVMSRAKPARDTGRCSINWTLNPPENGLQPWFLLYILDKHPVINFP